MSQIMKNDPADLQTADPKWKELYWIGGIASVTCALIVVFAVVAFFIWPYLPGEASAESVFVSIQEDRFGALMALDLMLLIGAFFTLPMLLAIYVALKGVNESYALIALVLGLVAVIAILPARPIVELLTLSDLHAAATTDLARQQYLAAGETLLAFFSGTAWMVNLIFTGISFLISSILMLRSDSFSKSTAYVGIISNAGLVGFFLPVIGIFLLFVFGTVLAMVWCLMLAREFFRLARQSAAI